MNLDWLFLDRSARRMNRHFYSATHKPQKSESIKFSVIWFIKPLGIHFLSGWKINNQNSPFHDVLYVILEFITSANTLSCYEKKRINEHIWHFTVSFRASGLVAG